jgi:hypothetical protein
MSAMNRTVLAGVRDEGREVAQRRISAVVVEVALAAGAVAGRRADVVVCIRRKAGGQTYLAKRKAQVTEDIFKMGNFKNSRHTNANGGVAAGGDAAKATVDCEEPRASDGVPAGKDIRQRQRTKMQSKAGAMTKEGQQANRSALHELRLGA